MKKKMKILVVGGSGATGRLVVSQLLNNGHQVKVIVRSLENIPDQIIEHMNLSVIQANLLDISNFDLREHTKFCDAVVSCLGHNMTIKGIYGQPLRLVTDATRRLCNAVKENQGRMPVKFILMNTTGNRNYDLNEPISFTQSCVMFLIRHLLPPHADNEKAAEYLRTEIGQDDKEIEWAAVRPDSLINIDEVTEYEIHPSPIRSAIFDAGKTSRINVSHFMVALITDGDTWLKWKGKMPVIYNKEQ